MAAAPEGSLRVEALGPQHDRSSFASGVEPLDRYLRGQAAQDDRKNIAAPFARASPSRLRAIGEQGGPTTMRKLWRQFAEHFEIDVIDSAMRGQAIAETPSCVSPCSDLPPTG